MKTSDRRKAKGGPFVTIPILPDDPLRQHRLEALSKGAWGDYLITFNGHECLRPFLSIQAKMPDNEYWPELAAVWQHAEFAHPDRDLWEFLFFKNRDRGGAKAMMNKAERRAWSTLPKTFTVYRGQQDGRHRQGFSWTLSLKTAAWFASMRGGDRMKLVTAGRWKQGRGIVLAGIVKKADALCYLNNRGEEEILVHPRWVHKISKSRPVPTILH